jgi:protocatechuate 3,4-dioxygenase beta subunit
MLEEETMSDNDDVLIGRLLSRREMLGFLGAAGVTGAAFIVGCGDDGEGTPTGTATQSSTATEAATEAAAATAAPTAASTSVGTVPACVVIPELTEGPFFVDTMLDRSDIRSDPSSGAVSDGDQLDLVVNVSRVGGDGSCTPLADAMVDVWHCDALGAYSGVQDATGDNTGLQFLRGFQNTDANGQARFVTVYPGWYQGRATHIHFKIRTDDGRSGAGYEFTSQWFFDDALSDQVHAQGAYASKGAAGRLQNGGDGIFGGSDGMLTLAVEPSGAGYAATFDIGLQV